MSEKPYLPDGRKLAIPDATSFSELFPKVRPYAWEGRDRKATPILASYPAWDKGSWSDPRGQSPDCHLSGFLSVSPGHRSFYVDQASPEVLEAVSGMLHGSADTITFQVIKRSDGTALALAQYSQIIGSCWLAIIDADTIPTGKE